MYFNKIAITLLVIFSICASFVIGFFSRDFYNQIAEQNRKERESSQQQFFMQLNSGIKASSSTLTPQEEYQKVLKEREVEAEIIKRALN